MLFKHLPTTSQMVGIGQPCCLDDLHQPAAHSVCLERRLAVDSALQGKSTFSSLSMNDYQLWAGLDWKAPHNTPAACNRLCNKLHEEVYELLPELEKQIALTRYESRAVNPVKSIVSEMGDVLWCLNGLATFEGIDLQRALAHHLLDESGVSSLTFRLGSIDTLIQEGLRPRYTRNLYNDEDLDHCELNPATSFLPLCFQIYSHTNNKLDDVVGDVILTRSAPWAQDLSAIGQMHAQAILFLAYYAHRWGGSNLAAVVETNIRKINLRVQSKHLDKVDGARTAEEL